MPHYAIFDREAGMLQFDVAAADKQAAMKAFDALVGIDPHSDGLDAVADEFLILPVSPAEMAKITAWVDRGSKASEAPAFLSGAFPGRLGT